MKKTVSVKFSSGTENLEMGPDSETLTEVIPENQLA